MTYPNELTNPAQANWPVRVNEALKSLRGVTLYAPNDLTTTGLVWGYFGGDLSDSVSVADGVTTSLASATIVYAVMHRTTGVLTHATTTTNWNDTATYGRVRRFVTGASSITSSIDWRILAGGIFDRTGVAGAVVASSVSITDAGTYYTGTDVEAALQEAGAALATKATTAYVDAALAGLSWKQQVRAATTAAVTLASDLENGDTIDGVVLATGNRILVKNQASATENGIYVVAASGAPTRAADADSGAELVNASVYVSEGTTLADTQWTCTTNATITIGATNIAFAQLSSSGPVDADDVTYTPTTVADWDGSADPGDVEQALDQLAERVTDLEGAGSGSGTKTWNTFTWVNFMGPASNYATFDTRNSRCVYDFDDTTDENILISGKAPQGADTSSGINVILEFKATTATTGNGGWGAAWERGTTDADADSFDTETTGVLAVSGTSGISVFITLTCTTIDSIVAGDSYVLKVGRRNASDTVTGDLELVSVEVQQVA